MPFDSYFQGYYRLGSCLNFLGHNSEALKNFCDGLKRAETDDDKFSLASHIISTAMDVKGTLFHTYNYCLINSLKNDGKYVFTCGAFCDN